MGGLNSTPSDDWFRALAGRASTRAERAAGVTVEVVAPASDAERLLVNDRWQRWRTLSAADDDEKFARRLREDGLDEASARRSLFPARLRDESSSPPWIETLRAARAAVDRTTYPSGRRCLDPDHPQPFEEILLPFVETAREQLAARAGRTAEAIGGAAQAKLERRLLTTLCHLAGPAFLRAFRDRCPDTRSGFDRLIARIRPEPSSTTQYDRFVSEQLAGGWVAFFDAYPVAARLLATAVDRWVNVTTEFMSRLHADRALIVETFCDGVDPGPVVSIGDAASDPHHGGRSVLALTFASGQRLVYKPKALALERRYFALLGWVNGQGVSLPFRILRVMERDGYGWVEHVAHDACQDRAAVARYYQRAGGLACVLYATGGSDCHYENLIASGEQPVVIDLEALLQPVPVATSLSIFAAAHDGGVLEGGLLPFWVLTSTDRTFDASALGGVYEQPIGNVQMWEAVNTDDMTLAMRPETLRRAQNQVVLDGHIQSPSDHVEAIVAGFLEMSALLRRHREHLVASDGPLGALRQERPRFVFRPTALYGRVLRTALDPACLCDGADRSVALDILSRPLLGTPDPHPFWPLRAIEQSSMDDSDVPHFTVRADTAAIVSNGVTVVPHAFSSSAFDRLAGRLAGLDEQTDVRQAALIRASLEAGEAWEARAPKVASGPAHPDASVVGESIPIVTPAEMIDAATRIGRDIAARAVRLSDGSARWIGIAFTPDVERYLLRELGLDLYNGAAGIALFLAALHEVAGDEEFRDLALAGLRPLIEAAGRHETESPDLDRLGAGWGLGSTLYTLVHIADLLDAPHLLDAATESAERLTPERIAGDLTFDVLGGSAGAILGLLALHSATHDASTLDRAIACGRHLTAHRSATAAGPRAWSSGGATPLTGFSHGTAGIAYALLRLHAVTGDHECLRAAEEGFEYERCHFSAAAGNWTDLRPDRPARFVTAWCHGAPGIGLSRLAALPVVSDATALHGEIAAAMATTMAVGVEGVDPMCCGNAGRADILMEAGARLERADWHEAGQRILSAVLRRHEATGDWHLLTGLPAGICNPVLFRGTAGIGYTLLRAARPGTLPSVLLWEPAAHVPPATLISQK